MKAAQIIKYSKDFEAKIVDVPIPEINDDEVLVQVKAAAVNPLEKLIGTGAVKLIQNYSMPLILGNEMSGIVVKVGKNVTQYQINDAVYSRLPLTKIGAFAEYVAVEADAIGLLAANLDFASGVAVPLTGLTAFQGLHEELEAKAGESVFISGGSGSFGQLAVPIAKSMGLKVIVSGNSESQEHILALGADQYIDYKRENYWEVLHDVDYVIDTLGASEIAHELSIIKSDGGGRLLSLQAGPNRRFAIANDFPFWKQKLFSISGMKVDSQAAKRNIDYHFIFVRSDGKQLQEVTKIIEDNNIVPFVDPTHFMLDDINEALSLVAHGHPKGKVVIRF